MAKGPPTDDSVSDTPTARSLVAAKWGEAVNAGFQIVPNVLLRGQAKLGLDPIDVVVLLNIMMHWWKAGDLPYPQPRVIANRMGVSIRTVERRLESLAERGFIERLPTEKPKGALARRKIEMSGLVGKLEAFARANLEMRRAPDDVSEL